MPTSHRIELDLAEVAEVALSQAAAALAAAMSSEVAGTVVVHVDSDSATVASPDEQARARTQGGPGVPPEPVLLAAAAVGPDAAQKIAEALAEALRARIGAR